MFPVKVAYVCNENKKKEKKVVQDTAANNILRFFEL